MKLTKRVVSLLPSGTEILCIIPGGAELLVGRSHEDNFPASITHLPMLTSQLISKTWTDAAAVDREVSTAMAEGRSLYSLDEALLSSLRPDLIITQDLCSVCSIDLSAVRSVAARLDYQPTVISLNPYSIEEVLNDIIAVGSAVGLQEPAQLAKDALEARVEAAAAIGAQLVAARGRVKVAFIEWSDPIYIGGHWTPQLITMAGGEHTLNPAGEGNPLFGHVQIGGTGKSFPVTPEALVASDPDVIVVAPCGLHLEEARREVEKLMAQDWFREIKAVRKRRLLVVDGDAMFNRPGPRLVDALEWLVSVLH
ncbi:ABC transporter substrate-binding protein, partial [Ochromonadaceae sp. CCMP2298]